MADFTLYIGNKNYSSWSLRGWLMVKAAGSAFEEVLIRLRQPNTKAEVMRHSPSGRVPALVHGNDKVWESMAIGEYLAELLPDANLWPGERAPRAVARSVSTEMHAGFLALRNHFPMNVRSSFPNRASTPDVQADIDRITAIWHDCRTRFSKDGPFLFGSTFGNAAAMYPPVAIRFPTYKVDLDAGAQAYCDSVWSYPPMQEWAAAAKK